MIAREHTGRGWGDPADPSNPDVWLCDGYVCAYDPARPGRAELWSAFGRCDCRSVETNAARTAREIKVLKARGSGRLLTEWLGCTEIGSRFD